MAITPLFDTLAGTTTATFILSSSLQHRFLTGTLPSDTVDVQVSIQGAAYTLDSAWVSWSGATFTVPNPSFYPDGLELVPGDNVVKVQSVLLSGKATSPATATIRLVTDDQLGTPAAPVTNIFVEQGQSKITLYFDAVEASTVKGYNVYASIEAGGGNQGYKRVNVTTLTSGVTTETDTLLGTLTSDVVANTTLADPLYYGIAGTHQTETGAVVQTDFDEAIAVPEMTTRIKTVTEISSVTVTTRLSFPHSRTANQSSTEPAIPQSGFTSIPLTDPLYYVVTAIHLIDNVEYESGYSAEVAASPLTVAPTLGTIPSASRASIDKDLTLQIFRQQPSLDIGPGSFTRDTFLDPFLSEAERIRFLIDFFSRASSVQTLLDIDDPNRTGTSVAVSSSAYKTALKAAFFMTGDSQVQAVIDNQFDKLASNVGATRSSGRRARGTFSIFTKARPTVGAAFNIGQRILVGGVAFRLTSSGSISPDGAGAAYNPVTGRYSVSVFAQAESLGTANLAKGLLGYVDGTTYKAYSVTNEAAISGGLSQDSNLQLALKTQRKLAASAVGTVMGLVNAAVAVTGVTQVSVVEAGNILMKRDMDLATGVHYGGKVDVYVKGSDTATVTDTFALTFAPKHDIHFQVVGDPQDLVLISTDPLLSPSNPILEMLTTPTMRNLTGGYTFDLTGVTITDYNTITLSSAYNDPTAISLLDVIVGSYRYRDSNTHTFTRQPVIDVVSVVGETMGYVSNYSLNRTSDPLDRGGSADAADTLTIVDSTVGRTVIDVTNEQHTILEGPEYLTHKGIEPTSIVVTSLSGTTTFALTTDYVLGYDDATQLSYVQRTEAGAIPIGHTVYISYHYDENVTVTYRVNSAIAVAQSGLDKVRNVSCDVLAKAAVAVPVDIEATVVLNRTQPRATTESNIRGALTRYMDSSLLGAGIQQSVVSSILGAQQGVGYVVSPLTKLSRQSGAMVVREPVLSSEGTLIEAWSTSQNKVYLITSPLEWTSTNDTTLFQGVFMSEEPLYLYTSPPNILGYPMRTRVDSAHIIDSLGCEIPGVSDDVTLESLYTFTTASTSARAAAIMAKRVEITANRVLVTLPASVDLADVYFEVTYTVGDTTSVVQDINLSAIEYLTLGTVTLSFDEETSTRGRGR